MPTNNNFIRLENGQSITSGENPLEKPIYEGDNHLRTNYLSRLSDSCRSMGKYTDFDLRWMTGYLVLIILAIIAFVTLF